MLSLKSFLNESSNKRFDPIKLDTHTKGMKKYSHDSSSHGYVDHPMTSDTSHKKIHAAAKAAGYHYTSKHDTYIDGKDMVHHNYTKTAGPFQDHHMTITTPKGSDKVWGVTHKTVKDNS